MILALPSIGTFVYSRIARDSPMFEKGIVSAKDTRIYIDHLNGKKLSHDPANIGFVIRNIVPLQSSLRVGLDVIAQTDDDDKVMLKGKVTEVILNPKRKRYKVEFEDGSFVKVTAGRLRIIPTYGEEEETTEEVVSDARKEQIILEMDGVSLRIEGYLGGQLLPMISFDTKLEAEVKDWSNKLAASATLTLQSTYYNGKVAEWEPLIEPVIDATGGERPWELSLKVSFTYV